MCRYICSLVALTIERTYETLLTFSSHCLPVDQVKTLQATRRTHGATDSSRMSKAECISYLRTKLGIPENFRKIFSKIWGASGKDITVTKCS